MDKVLEQLKELRNIKPRETWVKSNRHLLMSQITSQAPEIKTSYWEMFSFVLKMFLPLRFVNFIARPVGIITMITIMVLSFGSLTVNASKSSLPGNILYPVKITSEKVKVSLTVSEDKKAKMHADNAEKRLQEINIIINSDDNEESKNKKISVASDNLKKEMESVSTNLDKVKDKKGEKEKVQKSMEIVKAVDQQIEEISQKLQEGKKAVLDNNNVIKIINETQDIVDQVGVKTVEVLIEKYDKGEVELTSEEVFHTVEKKIKNIEDKIAEIKEKESQLAEQNLIEIEVLEPVVENDSSDEDDVVVEKSEIMDSGEATETLEEAVLLLNSGDLVSALEKVKESNDLADQVEDSVDIQISENEQIEVVIPVVEEEENVVVPVIE
jgi:hypothetical protein